MSSLDVLFTNVSLRHVEKYCSTYNQIYWAFSRHNRFWFTVTPTATWSYSTVSPKIHQHEIRKKCYDEKIEAMKQAGYCRQNDAFWNMIHNNELVLHASIQVTTLFKTATKQHHTMFRLLYHAINHSSTTWKMNQPMTIEFRQLQRNVYQIKTTNCWASTRSKLPNWFPKHTTTRPRNPAYHRDTNCKYSPIQYTVKYLQLNLVTFT